VRRCGRHGRELSLLLEPDRRPPPPSHHSTRPPTPLHPVPNADAKQPFGTGQSMPDTNRQGGGRARATSSMLGTESQGGVGDDDGGGRCAEPASSVPDTELPDPIPYVHAAEMR
jgi:hypothetical protein